MGKSDTGPVLNRLKAWLESARSEDAELRRRREEALGRAPVPELWLFGKVGSGKSSIVRYLTGARKAEIGSGFRPQTRRSRRYDFPSAEEPVLRFVDTRGLGEVEYDPTEDIAELAATTQVMIVTVRVTDHALDGIVEPLRAIRKADPGRPVVLALTSLHDCYPGEQHPPYPFAHELPAVGVAPALARSIGLQEERFRDLVDWVVPIDLTRPEEGFEESEYGGERLKEVLLECLPRAYRQTLLTLEETLDELGELNERRAAPYILGASTLAASAAAVPVPWVDVPVVTAIQGSLLYKLAEIYGRALDRELALELAGALGGRMLARGIVRSTLKLFPVLGAAANAALAFGYTYALGRTACWYYGEKRAGNAPAPEELKRVWGRELERAEALWKRRQQAAETTEAS
jgi:uncharacterized protein (DUF697 family)/predicted GTPase